MARQIARQVACMVVIKLLRKLCYSFVYVTLSLHPRVLNLHYSDMAERNAVMIDARLKLLTG
jgi:hypothetical protein